MGVDRDIVDLLLPPRRYLWGAFFAVLALGVFVYAVL